MSGYLQKPASGGVGGGTWGSITGTLSNQTDLQNALNLKYDASNPAGYITASSIPTNISAFTNDVGYITSSALSGYLQNNVGISGGTTLIGGTATGENLTLSSTSHATKGKILFGTSAYDEVNNSLGIGTTNPVGVLDIYKSDNANPLLMRIWNVGSGGAKLRFVAEAGGTAQHQWTTDKYLAAIAANNTIGMQFRVGLNATEAALDASTRMTITTNGKVGIGTTTPTALLMLEAGTATANTAPLKFTSGTNLTTPEAGAFEYDGSSLFFTRSGTLRAGLLMTDTASPFNTYSQSAKGATTFTTGANNVLIGFEAGKALTTSSDSVYIGHQSGNTAVLNASGGRVVTLGAYAGGSTATLYGGVYLGYSAGYAGTDLSGTVAIGQAAAYAAGTLKEAIMIGTVAGQGAISANNGIGIGYQALFGAIGADNAIFLGATAGHNALNATYTIGIGSGAGRNAQGSVESIYIGRNAGYNAVSTGVTGDFNLGLGTDTLKALTTGAGNIALGYKVGDTITTGSKNVAIGYDIDYQSNTADGQLTIQNAIFGTGNTGTGTTVSTGKIGIFTVAPTCALDVTGGIATSRTTVTAPATTDGNIFSGTYTPTLTGVTNVTSSTAYVCQYMRVGNVVTVSGKIEVTPTLNNAQTTIGISLPIASNFANSGECGGSSHTVANTTAGHGAAIYADATNDRAEMDYFETHGVSDTFAFSFTYQII